MTRNQEFELVTRAVHSLQKAREAARASDAYVVDAQQAMAALLTLYGPNASVPAPNLHARIVLANGRRLAENEARALDEDNFDLVLDMAGSTLRYREDPKGHRPLTLANLQGIGPYRIRILAFLMEHPGVHLCADNVDQLLGDTTRIATPQAFTKNISILRQALGGGGSQNRYIQSISAWESSRRSNARAYRLNPQWKYLLIRHGEFKESLISHQQGREKVTALNYNEPHG